MAGARADSRLGTCDALTWHLASLRFPPFVSAQLPDGSCAATKIRKLTAFVEAPFAMTNIKGLIKPKCEIK